MRDPWYFVLPEERTQPSGGNIYNDRLIQALERVDQAVKIISSLEYIKAIREDVPNTYWVDTLVLNQMPELLSLSPSQALSILIVHHLESLAPSSGQSVQSLRDKEQSFLNWFQGFLATSPFTRDYLQRQGFTQPVLVAEPGVDATTDVPPRTTESIRALMVANLVERKGLLPWLQWLAERVRGDDRFSLTIVGRSDIEPSYAKQCTDLVQNNNSLNRRVTIVGSQPPERMPSFYRQANLVISTAWMETFGMAIQEAVVHRLPVLALEGGYSAQHIASGKNGVVFAELSRLGDFFLTLAREPAKFTTLYQQAQQHSPGYLNWSQTARSLLEQFDQFFNYAP